MHPAIQAVFLLRDKDLLKWGRGIAILLFIVAAICFGATGFAHHMTESRLKPALHRNLESEIKLVRFLEKKGHDFDAEGIIAAQRKAHESILTVLGSLAWIFAGSGLLALSSGMVSWRAHELARQKLSNAEQPVDRARSESD